ncbi:MAG: bifunctional demethylmenaquinone methyltransferase/2-methoxy-6-polyprenyl-1,4-benzoquinol methylase UbiE [Kiritimatiellia bacterium]
MKTDVEKITPYGGEERKSIQIEHAFDMIAYRYDFMNRLLSIGIDTLWRKKALKLLPDTCSDILDIATGTGDQAILAAETFPQANITGIDLSAEMLAIAEKKARRQGLSGRIAFKRGDCSALPFDSNSFDVVSISFGIRNFESMAKSCAEVLRVLRPGGLLVILELSRPQAKLLSGFYSFYLNKVTPALGRLFTGRTFEYTYLQKSIGCVPQGNNMLSLLSDSGFTECRNQTYTFGICSCYTAEKHISGRFKTKNKPDNKQVSILL